MKAIHFSSSLISLLCLCACQGNAPKSLEKDTQTPSPAAVRIGEMCDTSRICKVQMVYPDGTFGGQVRSDSLAAAVFSTGNYIAIDSLFDVLYAFEDWPPTGTCQNYTRAIKALQVWLDKTSSEGGSCETWTNTYGTMKSFCSAGGSRDENPYFMLMSPATWKKGGQESSLASVAKMLTDRKQKLEGLLKEGKCLAK